MNQKKKNYRTPIIRIVKLDTGNILADSSDFPVTMEMGFDDSGTNNN